MNIQIDRLNLLTLNVGFAKHNGDWNWENVRSPFSRLYYVTEGEAQVCIGSDCYSLKPDYLYFIPAFTEHSYICNKVFAHYYVHIYEDQQSDNGIIEEYSFPFETEASAIDLDLIKRLCDMNPLLKLPESDPRSYDNHPTLVNNIQMNQKRLLHEKMESKGILFILMSRFFKHAVPKTEVKDDRIYQTMTYIRKHLDTHLEIDTLADMTCMSKDHFIRIFKKETGETPNTFITKRRLEKAELLLISTNIPIKGIAQMLGYSDFSYFNRVFKQNSGITPQQYREGKHSHNRVGGKQK